MRKILAIIILLGLAACADQPTSPDQAVPDLAPLQSLTSNGFPQGSHDYKLNIIGVPKDKTADMDNNNGHRIFVQLFSANEVTNPGGKNNHLAKGGGNDQNQIYLCNSTDGVNDVNDARCDAWRATHVGDFGVIDANATDGDGAIFGIPDPCADADPLTACTPSYAIFARAHGPKNGGSAVITTCADEWDSLSDGNDVWCGSNGTIELTKQSTRKAVDVTDSLLRMEITVDPDLDPGLSQCLGTADVEGDQAPITYSNIHVFDNCFENYFWNYDNNGLKLLELRFYSTS